jgi:hypothetical protein
MKHIKKMLRVCALIFFLLLTITGMGIFGIAPPLYKDRKLFACVESKAETAEENTDEVFEDEKLKF